MNGKVLKKILLNYKKNKIKNIGVSVYNKYELENILKVFKPDVVAISVKYFFSIIR